jgi:hypothetical protein
MIMHFVTFVITESKPTDALLSDALAPFGPDGTGRWDAWTLGGRYSGNLPVKRLEDTMTGGDEIPDSDLALISMLSGEGLRMERSGHLGAGVDAAQIKNVDFDSFRQNPLALVFNGDWHQCPIFPVEALAVKLGIPIEEESLEAERTTMRQWDNKLADLLHDVSDDDWLAILDCHT